MNFWSISGPIGKFYGHLVYIFCAQFGTFFLILVRCTKKNLATLKGAVTYLCKKKQSQQQFFFFAPASFFSALHLVFREKQTAQFGRQSFGDRVAG
jgi:hypothetical protein